ncbi:MAG: TolC family protein, partial [Nitrospiria bacterium]
MVILGVDSMAMAQTPMTLEEVYSRALMANEQIMIAREGMAQARDEKDTAFAVMLPSVGAVANYTRRPDAILSTSGNVIRTKEEDAVQLRITQPLYTGGRAMATYSIKKEGIKESMEALRSTQEDLLFEVATAYYNVLKAKKNQAIAEVEVERLEKHLKASQSRFNVGEVTKTIVLRSQAELSGARAELVRAATEVKNARERLSLLAKLPADFEISDPPAPSAPPGTEEDLIQQAYQKRSDLATSHIREAIALKGIRFARGGFFPTLSLEGIYSRLHQDPENPFFFAETDKLATLTLTFPLFEGGLRMAELREAHSKARQADLERTLLENRVDVEVKNALHDLTAVESVLENFKDQVAFAQENFTLVEKQFAFGLATNIDVLDANSLLHDAQRQLSNATYNRDLAVLRLQKTVGLFLKGI